MRGDFSRVTFRPEHHFSGVLLQQGRVQLDAACRRRGRHVGIGGLGTRPDLVEKFVKLGARYVSTGNDLAFLLAECTRRARQVKDLRTC